MRWNNLIATDCLIILCSALVLISCDVQERPSVEVSQVKVITSKPKKG